MMLLFIVAGLQSCKKDKTERDYGKLAELSQPLNLFRVDSATAEQLYSSVAAERNLFLTKLENDYPGLLAQMQYDLMLIGQESDSSTQALLIDDFKQSYYQQVKTTWDNSGINLNALRDKYSLILGNVPFNVGEFGGITIALSAEAEISLPQFADDSSTNFQAWEDNTYNTGCVGIAGNYVEVNSNYCNFGNNAGVAGGCGVNAVQTRATLVPGNTYKYFAHTANYNYGSLLCTAVAVGGGGYASGYVRHSLTSLGTELNARDVASISAVAPIIWFAQSSSALPSVNTVATQSNTTFSTVDVIAVMKSNTYAAGGGLSGGISRCLSLTQFQKVRMIK